MNVPLTDQIRDYFVDASRRQGAADLAAVIRGAEGREVTMVDLSIVHEPPARLRKRRVGALAAAAVVVVLVVGLVVTRSDDREPVVTAPGTTTPTTAASTTATSAPPIPEGPASSEVITIEAAALTGSPEPIVQAGGAIWFPNAADDAVVRVDTTTGDAVDVPMGATVISLVASDEALWVSMFGTGDVVRIDLASAAVTDTIAIVPSTDGATDLIIADGGLWVTSRPAGSSVTGPACCPDAGYTRIDLTTLAVTVYSSDVYLGDWIGELDGGLWAYNAFTTHLQDSGYAGNALTRVDLNSGQAQRYDLPDELESESSAMLAGDDIWLVDIFGAVARFDVESGLLNDQLTLPGVDARGGVFPAGVDDSGGLWLEQSLEGTVVRIDTATAEVTDTITLEPQLGFSLLLGDSLWVTKTIVEELPSGLAFSDGVVYQIDLVTRSVVETVDTGLDGQLFPFLRNGEVWVAASDGQTVRLTAIA